MNLTTDDADGKIRLDQYLAAHLPELSRSRIQNLIKSGDVLVNGSPGGSPASGYPPGHPV